VKTYFNLKDLSLLGLEAFCSALSYGIRFKLKEADTLIAMTGAQVGKVSFVPKTDKYLLLNQRVGLYTKKADWLGFSFLWQILNSEYYQVEVVNRAQGAAQPNISATDLLGISCVIPENKYIIDFEEKCDCMYEEVRLLQNKNNVLKQQRDMLLPRLISGKIKLNKEL
jgi:type I restriction enzyme S subunit